ncbi:MAG: hypothetical protein PHF50_02170 [Patescibacteria group bacterium]|nr:hypothetical protein [Patescibacteria group bacterium]
MFDELDSKNLAAGESVRPAGSAPTKAEDIFSEVDKAVKPEVFRPRAENPLSPTGTVIPANSSWFKNKGLIAGLIFGGLIIVIGGGYIGLKLMVKSKTPAAMEVSQEANSQITPEVAAPAAENNAAAQLEQPAVTQPVDSDQDGLTDEEEVALGTSPGNPDTDNDGLTDREEVKVYNTDPLNPDSDGDTYQDGQEVKGGFDPKGPGKLFEINNQEQ